MNFLGFFNNSFNDTAVALESAGRRKLSQAMAHHVFGDKDVDEFAAIMDREITADEFRRDLWVAGVGFDWAAFNFG